MIEKDIRESEDQNGYLGIKEDVERLKSRGGEDIEGLKIFSVAGENFGNF